MHDYMLKVPDMLVIGIRNNGALILTIREHYSVKLCMKDKNSENWRKIQKTGEKYRRWLLVKLLSLSKPFPLYCRLITRHSCIVFYSVLLV
jgi:hypothetical protein